MGGSTLLACWDNFVDCYNWRFLEVEFLTGLLIMAPEFIGGLCRDIAAIIEDKKKEP